MKKMPSNKITRMGYNFVNISDDTTDLEIYDYIAEKQSEDFWTGEANNEVTPTKFKEQLNSVKTPNICVRINSGGGEMYAANMISVAIQEARENGKNISCKIDGICASAAVGIALSCEPVEISRGAYMMIHNPLTVLFGMYNALDLETQISTLKSLKDGIVSIYEKKTGLSKRELSKMMDSEKWMSGEEAVELGFADKLMFEEDNKQMDTLMMNSNLALAYNSAIKIPDYIKQNLNIQEGGVEMETQQEFQEVETTEQAEVTEPVETETTTATESSESETTEPVVENVSSETPVDALAQERARLKALDSLTGKVDQELIDKAKYETFETAEQVALNALTSGKTINLSMMNSLKNETAMNKQVIDSKPVSTPNTQETEAYNIAKKHLQGGNK